MYRMPLQHLEKSPVKNIDFWASYGQVMVNLGTRARFRRSRFEPLRPNYWS